MSHLHDKEYYIYKGNLRITSAFTRTHQTRSLCLSVELFKFQQENHIQILERRHQFALHCIHLETQLVHISMEILVQIFQSMSFVFANSHAEVSVTFF